MGKVEEKKNEMVINREEIYSRGADGIDEATSEDVLIPRISLIHGQSAVFTENPEAYKVGRYYETLGSEMLPEGVEVIPILMFKNYVKFVDNELKWSTTNPTPEQLEECEYNDMGDAPTAKKQFCFFVLLRETLQPYILALSGASGGRAGKTIITHSKLANRPVYTFAFKLSSKKTQSADGHSYFKTTVDKSHTELTDEELRVVLSYQKTVKKEEIAFDVEE